MWRAKQMGIFSLLPGSPLLRILSEDPSFVSFGYDDEEIRCMVVNFLSHHNNHSHPVKELLKEEENSLTTPPKDGNVSSHLGNTDMPATFERRHFEQIAEIIRSAPFTEMATSVEGPWTSGQRATIAQFFARALAATNPNFDRAKFLAACGVDSAS